MNLGINFNERSTWIGIVVSLFSFAGAIGWFYGVDLTPLTTFASGMVGILLTVIKDKS